MRNIKYTAGLALIACTTLFFIFHLNFKYYWAEDSSDYTDSAYCSYFKESYDQCRSEFLKQSAFHTANFKNAEIGTINIPCATDTNLFVDWCYIPAQLDKEKLLILNSGLHGIEGYAGSAVQLFFLKNHLSQIPPNMGVLLIHGINPYGFKYNRKVTENNIDLNRNCVLSINDFNTKNEGFGEIKDLLMPQKPADLSSADNQMFFFRSIIKLIEKSMPVLRQATLQGQYSYPKGFYYGGKKYEPQIEKLKPLISEKMNQYKIITNIDLHTGYGERGNMHLFLNKPEDTTTLNAIKKVFREEKIDWGCSEDFYTIKGSYVEWANSLAPSALCIPMMLEFGTLNSQEIMGTIKSLQVMVLENQGINKGYADNKDKIETTKMFSELYYPASKVWRSQVIAQIDSIMPKIITNFSMLE